MSRAVQVELMALSLDLKAARAGPAPVPSWLPAPSGATALRPPALALAAGRQPLPLEAEPTSDGRCRKPQATAAGGTWNKIEHSCFPTADCSSNSSQAQSGAKHRGGDAFSFGN